MSAEADLPLEDLDSASVFTFAELSLEPREVDSEASFELVAESEPAVSASSVAAQPPAALPRALARARATRELPAALASLYDSGAAHPVEERTTAEAGVQVSLPCFF